MVRLTLDKDRKYMLATSTRPNDRLIEKLKKLGWKKGQCIYWDRNKCELRFFDSRDQLHDFLDGKPSLENGSSLDLIACTHLQMDELERLAGQ